MTSLGHHAAQGTRTFPTGGLVPGNGADSTRCGRGHLRLLRGGFASCQQQDRKEQGEKGDSGAHLSFVRG